MSVVYVYVLNTLADWEISHLISEVHSRRFFKQDAKAYEVRFVGASKNEITTMGGIKITPSDIVEEIIPKQGDILVLPGADTWNDSANNKVIDKAKEFLDAGLTVAAICGATIALANAGLLDDRGHTSNGVGFLDMFAPEYKGKNQYMDCPSYTDDNLITAACTGAILFTKQILKKMEVMDDLALDSWYDYFCTGTVESFYQLMQQVGR